jgi:hypothetical protein
MTPLSDGEVAILAKLADVAQHQAVTTERLIGVLERLNQHMERADDERDRAVVSVKAHITSALDKHDSWWRKFAIIMGGITAAAAALGSGLMRLLPFGTPPHK